MSAQEPTSDQTPASEQADRVLSVRNLTVTYGGTRGTQAVRGVSLDIGRGEVFGLVGESGSGKSSVCGALMRLLPSSATIGADRIDLGGHDIHSLDERAMARLRGSEIALVPQQPMTSLSPTTSVGQQLEWYLGKSLDDPQVEQTLVRIGLRAVLDRRAQLPSRFSGGQLQRLLIAIVTLSNKPSLLLADEPTTTLDATVQSQVLKLLLDIRDRMGLSILYVSHDLAVISQVCDRVGVLYGGRLVEVAPVAELFHHPRHPYTKALIGAIPVAKVRGERLATIGGSASGANRLSGCPFAPRCPLATDICREQMPEERIIGRGLVRCHHAEQEPAA